MWWLWIAVPCYVLMGLLFYVVTKHALLERPGAPQRGDRLFCVLMGVLWPVGYVLGTLLYLTVIVLEASCKRW